MLIRLKTIIFCKVTHDFIGPLKRINFNHQFATHICPNRKKYVPILLPALTNRPGEPESWLTN